MKLIVQIPCFNEEQTLPQAIAEIPREIPGIDCVEVLVIDDGSSDGTAEVAWQSGADHVIRHKANKGLAETFRTGIDISLRLGADIIVNTDGDNQYAGTGIPALIRPILDREAELVVGDRQVRRNPHYSSVKRRLHALGTAVVQRLSRTEVTDPVSGFRAFSRDAAMLLNIVSPFSYTIETLIQAGSHQIAVATVPIETNTATRSSRLFKSIPHFVVNSLATMLRVYAMYHPLRMFGYIGIALALAGLIPILRFLYFFMTGDGDGHVQSLVLGGVLVLMGFLALLFAILADLVNFNRRLVETTLQKVRRLEIELEMHREMDPVGDQQSGIDKPKAAAYAPSQRTRPSRKISI
jgi:glycosyltransferase involved in cell wall biosynthesis